MSRPEASLAARLAGAEDRFAAAFDHAPIGVALVGLDGRFQRVNGALGRILGRAGDDLLGGAVVSSAHPDDREAAAAFLARVASGEVDQGTAEARLLHPDGGTVTCQLDVALVRDGDGAPDHLVCHVQDIDARRVAAADLEQARTSQRVCLEALEQGVVMAGLEGEILLANDAAWRILGADPATFSERVRTGTWDTYDADGNLLPLEERPIIHTAITGEPVAARVLYITRDDGVSAALRVATEPVHGSDGELHGIVIAFADITRELELAAAQRQADEEVRSSKALLEAFLERSPDAICVHDAEGRIRYASPGVEAMLSHPLPVGRRVPFSRVHPDDAAPVRSAWAGLIAEPGSTVRVEARYRHDDGWRHLEVVATNRLDDPAVRGVVANVRDISERARAAAQLTWQAFHDGLTGLPNRALLMDRVAQSLERARRRGERVALLFVDLDRFKHVNDERGHETGDRLLVEVATRLQRTVRGSDTVARLGGDEFVVVAEGGDEVDITSLADRVRRALESPVVVDGLPQAVSASIGLAFDAGHPPERLLRDADAALYRAKERGRNRVEVFNEALRVAAQRRATVETTLRRVLDDGLVVVHHQPIVSLDDGVVVGTEALVRIPAGDGRLDPPREYLAVAEDRGLMVPLGEAVLHAVGGHLASWRATLGPDAVPFVAVNVSARQLGSAPFASRLAAALDRHGLRPRDIVVEFTEETVIGADRTTGRTIDALHEMGVRLWLDDFGTGYSSLAYLKRFPMDALKLDRSFVAGLGQDRSDTEIVRAVVALGRSLGLSVVAEGVEAPPQVQALRELGAGHGQGFHFGVPCPPDQVVLARRNLDALVGGQRGLVGPERAITWSSVPR